jgi:type IV pilus assembly protein PilC
MPIYQYKAKNLKGEEIMGEFEGASQEALEFMLREKGYFLVSAAREGAKKFTLLNKKLTAKELSVFSRQFAVLINAGVTIIQALSILQEQVTNARLRDALGDIYEEMQKGRVLSVAMADYPDIFPAFMMNMIRIGEASGALDMVLVRIANYYENDARIKRKVKSALSYPAILLILTVGVVILLMVKIVPMFSDILGSMGAELPGITLALVAVSNFMQRYFIYIIVVVAALIFLFTQWKKTASGRLKYDGFILRVPIIGKVLNKTITARFSRSLSILLKSGIPVIRSIEIIGDLLGNRSVERRFASARDEISQGKGISGPLKKLDIFPPLLIHMISVGESTGELDEMLDRTAGFFDEEVDEAISRMTMLIEPLLIVILAGVVALVILSVMLPMISLYSSIS